MTFISWTLDYGPVHSVKVVTQCQLRPLAGFGSRRTPPKFTLKLDEGLLILDPIYDTTFPPAMAPTRTIARLLGPSLLVTAVTEVYNAEIFVDSSLPVIYLNGTLLFVAGLSVVQAHNIWTPRVPALVTCMGWLTMGLGLARMAFPEAFLLRSSEFSSGLLVLCAALGAIGTTLSVAGYLGT